MGSVRNSWIGLALILISLFSLGINLYFFTLMYGRFPRLRRILKAGARSCGVDGSVCERVVQTPYARLFGGAPNVVVGLLWNAWVTSLAVLLLVTGHFYFLQVSLLLGAASVLVALYLIFALYVRLKEPCPL